jgi:hypothetical protein
MYFQINLYIKHGGLHPPATTSQFSCPIISDTLTSFTPFSIFLCLFPHQPLERVPLRHNDFV